MNKKRNERRDGQTGGSVDRNYLPWPSFCRCIHEKSMGGRWTWGEGDTGWMKDKEEEMEEEKRDSREEEHCGQSFISYHSATVTHVHVCWVELK